MLELFKKNLIYYWRLSSVPLRRKPDYLIVGAQKAGTTTMFNMLSRHPAVANPLNKEMHYFDRRDIRSSWEYRRHFPISSQKITGEATPSYLFYPGVAEQVRQELPDTKIVVVLRNPVDRAYSHYCMRQTRGKELLSFEDAIDAEQERLSEALESFQHQPDAHGAELLAHSYVARGLYATQLTDWYRQFPTERVFVMCYERFINDLDKEFGSLCHFLGIAREIGVEQIHLNSGRYPPMQEGTRRQLSEYFREPNRKLYNLIGDDFDWD